MYGKTLRFMDSTFFLVFVIVFFFVFLLSSLLLLVIKLCVMSILCRDYIAKRKKKTHDTSTQITYE